MKEKLYRLLKYKPIIFLDQLIFRINEDGVFSIGAQLAYFLVLSIFPFLIMFLNVIAYTPLVEVNVLYGLIKYLPLEIQNIIISFVNDIVITSNKELLSVAALAGIWTASSGVYPVIRAINKAYDFQEKRSYLKLKFLSVLFTLALLILLVLVFSTLVIGELLGRKFFEYLGRGELFLTIWSSIRFIIPIFSMIFIFSLLYKFSPSIAHRKDMKLIISLPGGIFATIGWIVTSTIFSFYVNNFGRYSITYGSLGGVIVLLVWLYLSSIIIVLGGEINGTIRYFKLNNHEIKTDMSIIKKIIDKL